MNEDYLELKSLGKQLYSFLKKAGFDTAIIENSSKSPYKGGTTLTQSDPNGIKAEIHQLSDLEQIAVAIPSYAVSRAFIIDKNNKPYLEQAYAKKRVTQTGELNEPEKYWTNIKNTVFGEQGKIANSSDIMKDPQIQKYIKNLGTELINIIKAKKPNMLLSFEDTNTDYVMYFAEPKTAKGGTANSKQRPNAPKPAATAAPAAQPQQESINIDSVVNEALRKFRNKK